VSNYLIALALGALPAAANFLGGILAEFSRVSARSLSLALHLAAGIVIAVVAVELIPQALEVDAAWVPILAFVLGGGFYLAVDTGVERLTKGRDAGPFIIFFGVAIDLFSDGIMIGTGTSIEFGLGLLLALGQTPADVPEGFAAIATFKNTKLDRRTRLLLAAAFAFPIMLGVTLGYWGVRGQSELVQFSLLAFTAGVLTTVTVEEIIPESHKDGSDSRLATGFFVGGFALFALVAEYLG
jgi:zinc transporter, ZIP family